MLFNKFTKSHIGCVSVCQIHVSSTLLHFVRGIERDNKVMNKIGILAGFCKTKENAL